MRKFHLIPFLVATIFVSGCIGGGDSGNSNGNSSSGSGTGGEATPQHEVTTTTGNGGSTTPQTAIVSQGDEYSFSLNADEGYAIESVSGCGGTLDGNSYTTGEISSDCTVEAVFSPESHTVSASAGEGGSISPQSFAIPHGDSLEFTVTAAHGYRIESVTGCAGDLDNSTYSTGPITDNCEITAKFVANPVPKDFLIGTYDGVMLSPKNTFFTDSTSITFENTDDGISITLEAFFGETCELEGELRGEQFPLQGSGTFQCSDFTSGTWTSDMIAKTDAKALLSEFQIDPNDEAPYTVKISGFRASAPDLYHERLNYWVKSAELEHFNGSFEGRLQSADGCASLTFPNSSTDLTIDIEGDQIELKQDSFYEGVCNYNGTIDNIQNGVISASGTFSCSNFDEGMWETDRLVLTDSQSMFGELDVNVPGRGCGYSIRYLGFRGESESISTEPENPDEPEPESPDKPKQELTLEQCDLFGCANISFPVNIESSSSLIVTPIPTWYTVREYTMTVGGNDVVIRDLRGEVVSGNAEGARIDGLSEGVKTSGDEITFELQSARSSSQSIIEFEFEIEESGEAPVNFFERVRLTTN